MQVFINAVVSYLVEDFIKAYKKILRKEKQRVRGAC